MKGVFADYFNISAKTYLIHFMLLVFLDSLKTSEIQGFSDVFRGYRKKKMLQYFILRTP